MIEWGSHISAIRYISYLLGNRTYFEVELDVPGRVSYACAARSRFGQAKGGEKMSGKVRGLHEIPSPPIVLSHYCCRSEAWWFRDLGHPLLTLCCVSLRRLGDKCWCRRHHMIQRTCCYHRSLAGCHVLYGLAFLFDKVRDHDLLERNDLSVLSIFGTRICSYFGSARRSSIYHLACRSTFHPIFVRFVDSSGKSW